MSIKLAPQSLHPDSTSAPANTGDQQWFPASQQMIVTSSSFYDPTQASGFTPQQPTVNVWDAQFIGPGGEYFPRQNTSYQQPYRFEGAGTSQYPFAQDQVQQQNSQPRPLMHTARRSARGSAQPSGYYRQGGAQSQLLPFLPILLQPNHHLLSRLNSQQVKSSLHSYPAQRSQPHFLPPPTQSQFQIRQSQSLPTPEFSQSQFSQPDHPHVPTQSLAHPQSQPQVHTPPNPSQQSQHYSAPSDPYYLQTDMYYAMNTQGSQSVPSLVSFFLLVLVLDFFGWQRTPPISFRGMPVWTG
ncbi:hypothetical protein BD769DRAFT_1677134 [Suillus cothurnatus]|nr:hypothetical protein BD769DRAFT_1677134 [Suillus cothurnatus]